MSAQERFSIQDRIRSLEPSYVKPSEKVTLIDDKSPGSIEDRIKKIQGGPSPRTTHSHSSAPTSKPTARQLNGKKSSFGSTAVAPGQSPFEHARKNLRPSVVSPPTEKKTSIAVNLEIKEEKKWRKPGSVTPPVSPYVQVKQSLRPSVIGSSKSPSSFDPTADGGSGTSRVSKAKTEDSPTSPYYKVRNSLRPSAQSIAPAPLLSEDDLAEAMAQYGDGDGCEQSDKADDEAPPPGEKLKSPYAMARKSLAVVATTNDSKKEKLKGEAEIKSPYLLVRETLTAVPIPAPLLDDDDTSGDNTQEVDNPEQTKAAIRMQACVRGYLARNKALEILNKLIADLQASADIESHESRKKDYLE